MNGSKLLTSKISSNDATLRYVEFDSDIIPKSTVNIDLGNSSSRFTNVYSNSINTINLETTELLPSTSNAEIGNSSNKFKNIHTQNLNAVDVNATDINATDVNVTDVNTTNIETKTIKIPTTDNTKHTTVTYENNNVKYTNSDGEIVYGITTSKDNPNKIDPKFLDFTCLKFGGTINPNKNYTIDIFDGNNLSTNILTYQNNVTYGSSILVNFDNTLGSSALNQQQIDSISGLYFLSSESGNLIYPSVVLSLTKNELLTKNQKWFKENFSICSEHTWNDIFGSDSDTATLISSTNINISLQEINDESSSLNTLDNTGSQTYKYIEFNQNVQTNIRMVSGKKISVSAMDIILFVNKTHNSTSVTTQQINENAGNT